MRIAYLTLPAALSALAALGACTTDPPRTTQVIIQQPGQLTPPVSPIPPPTPQAELVPPPPPSPVPTVWQPGHWRYTGFGTAPWSWVGGQYVALPPGANTWVQGQWVQANNGWMWQEGHWG
jgi:hypothetical protein